MLTSLRRLLIVGCNSNCFNKSRVSDSVENGTMKRGEVWWGHVDTTCPLVILSQQGEDMIRAMMIVAPATTNIDGYAVEVRVGAAEGLPFDGVLRAVLPRPGRINCSWLVTLSRSHLLDRAGVLSSAKLQELEDLLLRGGLE